MKGEWLFRSEGNNLLRCDCKIVIVKRFCDPSIGWSMLFSFMSLHSALNFIYCFYLFIIIIGKEVIPEINVLTTAFGQEVIHWELTAGLCLVKIIPFHFTVYWIHKLYHHVFYTSFLFY